jgi:hypothetical protein
MFVWRFNVNQKLEKCFKKNNNEKLLRMKKENFQTMISYILHRKQDGLMNYVGGQS